MKINKHNILTVIDIGSAKISSFCAHVLPQYRDKTLPEILQNAKIIAGAELPSQGFSHGIITDLQAVKKTVQSVIQTIEKQIDIPIDEVWINTSGGSPENHYIQVETNIDFYVTDEDVEQLYYKALLQTYEKHDHILHALPIDYRIDEDQIVSAPIGMAAKNLQLNILMVTAKPTPVRQLISALEHCKIRVKRCILSPFASALGTLAPSEINSRCVLIDIGAEITSIAAFTDGRIIFSDILKIGGNMITKDIANYFKIPLISAENLKETKGTCNLFGTEHDHLDIPVIGENQQTPTFETIPRAHLVRVIKARTEEILEKIHLRLKITGLLLAHQRLIITGGTANLDGIDDVAQGIFKIKPRIACPIRFDGVPLSMTRPEHSVLTGLLSYAIQPPKYEMPLEKLSKRYYQNDKPILHHIVDWLKYNF